MELVDTSKMLRAANAICLVAFMVAAAAPAPGSAQAVAAGGAPTNNYSPPASPAALEFLQGRCNPGVMPKPIARHCYDSLLPQAGAFNGSCIRVIGAATELMVANFRSFHAELLRLADGTKDKLGKCMGQAAGFAGGEPGKKEPEKLVKIRDLAAMGDDNKVDTVYDLVSWMDEVDMNFEGCLAEMKAVPGVEKLLPTTAVMYPSILVAEGLVSGYTPPQSTMDNAYP